MRTRNGNVATMPSYDKQQSITTRPIVPTLSSAAAKTVNKTPLTPRVAGPTQSHTSTPVARRGTRTEGGGGGTPAQISTPVSSFLDHNITPRSSSRKIRVDSTTSTPGSTPNGTPAPELYRVSNEPPVYGAGLGIEGLDAATPNRSTVTFSPVMPDVGASRKDDDNRFFYASDAKTANQQPRQLRPLLQTKSSNFFYANGDAIPPPISSGGSAVGSVTGSSMGEDRSQPKFFHASGTPDLRPKASHTFSTTGSTISTTSHVTNPRLGTLSPQPRPTSPSKPGKLASFPSLKNDLRSSPALHRPNATGRGQSAQDISPVTRLNTESFRRTSGHEKSASFGSLDLNPLPRRVSIVSPLAPTSPSSPPQLTATIVAHSPEPLPFDNESNGSASAVQSPIKTGQTLEQMNELAANARRERKVLDLEITNSSLAAINRTLEREMRKQTAELRRYRRLSRSGRLSIATSASIRSSGGGLSLIDEDGNPMSDLSEDSEEDNSDEESSEDESPDDASLSPSAMAESDARHRKKDEKRLQLDLSKHQQLLVDSQKMNQSLKRCLGWTEELINEGKKALAYHVRVSDVELGGRVLIPDEIEESYETERLSPIAASILSQARAHAAANGGWGGSEHTDSAGDIPLETETLSMLQDVPP